jgi:hypothetical protein
VIRFLAYFHRTIRRVVRFGMRNIDREINLVEDNAGVQIEVSCEDYDFNQIDLSGKTVHLFIKRSGNFVTTNLAHTDCSITDYPGGKAVYTVRSEDFPEPGTYFGDVVIMGGPHEETAPDAIRFLIRPSNK